ncbi:MAG TPA: GNAT family N-acetyltransferase [Caldilineaceae bacterium]|nr:GNAT family N-acetyltransferase [Caldilineaceae bacterium]
MSYQVHTLTAGDAAAYQPVRLRSLQEHPEAFGTAYEDEVQTPLDVIAKQLEATSNGFMLGAWQGENLVGIVGLHRSPRVKLRHRAGVGGMYIAPEARGLGIGKTMMQTLIGQAPTLEHLEEILLAVTVGNSAARSIYLAAGFEPSHIEKRYIKVGARYYDIEWMTLRLGSFQ